MIAYIADKLMSIEDAPPGLVLTEDGYLIFKTEYGDNDGNLDCYVLASGEKATVGNKDNREELVRPIILEVEPIEI